MIKFSNLLNDLLLTSSKIKKIELLCEFFKNSNLKDKGWAFCILTNKFERSILSSKDLKDLIYEQIDEQLFKYSYDYVGDLAETISLLWKGKVQENLSMEFFELIEFLISKKPKEVLKKKLKFILSNSNENQRYCILKVLTGGLRVGVSSGLIKDSLALYGKRDVHEIEEFWHGFKPPYTDFFEWLDGKNLPHYIDRKSMFNSFMLANNFKLDDFKNLKISDYFAEYKWDGIRAQIIFSKEGKIYSRNGENITESFPDIDLYDNQYFVIDGELVVKKNGQILSFNDLQKRIGRKKPTKKLLNDYPISFIAYDILFYNEIDCRKLKLTERRQYLNKFVQSHKNDKFFKSSLIKFSSWKDLEGIKENSLNNHIEGVVIKNKKSFYQKGRIVNGWYKWKRDPFSLDFIIMYAQRGHGKRSSFYSDFTFGCWVDDNLKELVPVGKAYSGFTNDELVKLDRWVRHNTIQRFGPVRSVNPGLVVEISFDNINYSSRHKSGIALRFPRFSRIRWDKPISEVSVLKHVKDLIN